MNDRLDILDPDERARGDEASAVLRKSRGHRRPLTAVARSRQEHRNMNSSRTPADTLVQAHRQASQRKRAHVKPLSTR